MPHTKTHGLLSTTMLVMKQPDRLRCLLNSLPKLEIKAPLDEFTFFPKLPVELRYRIWRLASHVPRRVALHAINDFAPPPLLKPAYEKVPQSLFPGQIRVPAILQASSESRIEGLRYYTKCEEKISIALKTPFVYLHPRSDSQFSTSSSDMVQVFEHLPLEVTNCIYVNFEVDTFVFQKRWANFHSFDTFFDPKALGKIKFLEGPSFQLHQCTKLFKMMGNLMHLTLTESKDWPWIERTYSDDLRGHLSLQNKKQELANRLKVDKLTFLSPEQRKRLLKVEFIPQFLIEDEDLVPVPEGF